MLVVLCFYKCKKNNIKPLFSPVTQTMFSIIKSCCKSLPQTFVQTQLSKSRAFYIPSATSLRKYSSDKKSDDTTKPGSFGTFKNTSTIIFDVDEEKQLARENPDYLKIYQKPEEVIDEFEDINLESKYFSCIYWSL